MGTTIFKPAKHMIFSKKKGSNEEAPYPVEPVFQSPNPDEKIVPVEKNVEKNGKIYDPKY